MAYHNFSRLSNTAISIAEFIITLLLSVLFIFVGVKYEGIILAGFMVLSAGFLFLSVSSVFTFIKCLIFGSENAFKTDPPKNTTDLKKFNTLSNMIAIFTLLFFICLVTGLIMLLK